MGVARVRAARADAEKARRGESHRQRHHRVRIARRGRLAPLDDRAARQADVAVGLEQRAGGGGKARGRDRAVVRGPGVDLGGAGDIDVKIEIVGERSPALDQAAGRRGTREPSWDRRSACRRDYRSRTPRTRRSRSPARAARQDRRRTGSTARRRPRSCARSRSRSAARARCRPCRRTCRAGRRRAPSREAFRERRAGRLRRAANRRGRRSAPTPSASAWSSCVSTASSSRGQAAPSGNNACSWPR